MSISIRSFALVLTPLLVTFLACGGSTSKTETGGANDDSGNGEPPITGSGPTGMCGTQACSGCCDTSGACQNSSSDTYCGTGGAACLDCSQVGATCQAGACTGGSSTTTSSSGSSSGGTNPFRDGGPFRGFDGGGRMFDGSFPAFDGNFPTRDGGFRGFDGATFTFDAGNVNGD